MRESIEEQVKKVIAEMTGHDAGAITNELSLSDDLGCDSLDLVEVTMELEETFGLEISDEDAAELQTVQDVIDYITDKVD